MHHEMTGSPEVSEVLLFGGLGYAHPYPTDWVSAADMILRDDAQALRLADLFVLSPGMLAVVVAAAKSLTVDDLLLMGPTDPPTPSGVVVLPQQLIVRTVSGALSDDRAYQWTPGQRILPRQLSDPRDVANPHGYEVVPGIRTTSYCATNGPVRPDSFVRYQAYAREQGTPLPPLLPTGRHCLPFHGTLKGGDLITDGLAGAARRVASTVRALADAQGLDEERLDPERAIGEHTLGDPIDDEDGMFSARFLYAFWRLCDQELALTAQVDLNRTSRDLAERADISTNVRVVQLRRTTRQAADASSGREWNHRWMVRMHKVRQWYPTQNTHKIIYRGPYIKGPANKPLLGGETVRALTR